jgi:NADPH:quinone reductase-like Zn-dependent oxidoreductase
MRERYGPPDVLQFAELATPTPADNEVMIRLCAASVNPLDLFLMKGAPWNRAIPGLRTPKQKILGCDIAGRVEAVGRNVKQFQPGDGVFGVTGFEGKGFAECVCAIEEKLARKPTCRLKTLRQCPLRRALRCRGFVTRDEFSEATKFLSKARPVGWARLPCRLPKRSGPK